LDESIGIDEANTLQLKFLSSITIVGATGFSDLWAWHTFFGSTDKHWWE